MPAASRVWRLITATLLAVLTLVLAIWVLSVLVHAVPGFTLPLLISTGLVVGLTWLIGTKLAGRWWLVGLTSLVFLSPFLLVMATLPRGKAEPKPFPAGHQVDYWNLSTGRQIGFIQMVPEEPNGQPPVVVLHGGPGGGTTDVDVTWGERFAAAGYQTYVYDQAGVGWSPRADKGAYSVGGSVADLEAIREALGVEELILAGHSWGGSLASHYALAHEQHVTALLLSAPGPFGGPRVERSGPNLTASSATQSLQLRRPLPFGVRVIDKMSMRGLGFVDELITHDVSALIVQEHGDPSIALDRGICAGDDPGKVPDLMRHSNFNIAANRSINRDLLSIDDSARLAHLAVPTLVLRGVCDYVPWEIHQFYRDTIPGAEMVIVEGVGHRSRAIEPMLTFLATGKSGFFNYRGAEFPTNDGS